MMGWIIQRLLKVPGLAPDPVNRRLIRARSPAMAAYKTEVRSHFVDPQPHQLPSAVHPCEAPEGYRWLHAYSPHHSSIDPVAVGKWLIRVPCEFVGYCWERVRDATEQGTLGIAAKVSTDWGHKNDPAFPAGHKVHVICVYTYNWQDRDDVLRVAKRLREIDAVRRQTLLYKPDAMTYAGIYSGNAPGEVAIYEIKPPYEELTVREEALVLLSDLASLRARPPPTPSFPP